MPKYDLAPQTERDPRHKSDGGFVSKMGRHKGRGGLGVGLGWVELEIGRRFEPQSDESALFVPESVFEIESGRSKTFDQKAIFFTSYLQQMFFQNRAERNGFYPVRWDKLKFLLGWRDYSNVLRHLETNGIIERDNHYIVGGKAIGYRISPAARGNVRKICLRSAIIRKKINQLRTMKIRTNNETHRQLAEIIGNRVELMNPHFVIDRARELYKGESLQYALMAIDALENGNLFFVDDPNTGRVFSNITNFPRELRCFLAIDQQPTIEVDIRCAQPLFLTALYRDHERGKPPTLKGLSAFEESRQFETTVLQEDFYTWLGKQSGAEWKSRDELKERVFIQVFFDRLRDYGEKDGRLWIGFKKEFPILAGLIKEVKKDDHAALAIYLQKIEAKVMIEGAAKDLLSQGIPIATVHDSIICREQDEETVKDAIESYCLQVVGVVPNLSVK